VPRQAQVSQRLIISKHLQQQQQQQQRHQQGPCKHTQ
jgi:hypothetical protein